MLSEHRVRSVSGEILQKPLFRAQMLRTSNSLVVFFGSHALFRLNSVWNTEHAELTARNRENYAKDGKHENT